MKKAEVEKWARKTEDRLIAELQRQDIRDTGELENSFRHVVEMASMDMPKSVKVQYAIQGLYVKLGVGKGSTAAVLAGSKTIKGAGWSNVVWKEQRINLLQQLYNDQIKRMKSVVDDSIGARFEMNF